MTTETAAPAITSRDQAYQPRTGRRWRSASALGVEPGGPLAHQICHRPEPVGGQKSVLVAIRCSSDRLAVSSPETH